MPIPFKAQPGSTIAYQMLTQVKPPPTPKGIGAMTISMATAITTIFIIGVSPPPALPVIGQAIIGDTFVIETS